ncbi:hypothetical protein NC796_21220 [Aliifodinibius sp. S!AR15-10]|uniref:hypothetical protein n=1 Tax=Aliifodinibius sp. S!AR15-10 TaxID=2950437 RepID=UPI00285B9D98|nr:hypothetical protein [Aliifodinibius sp. S!AR15-10]MDR8393689.1 hypothetical protein [Aliifodinibius sp. S!AR15-10]
MQTGYSGTPLLKKLGIKPGMTMMPVHEPDHYFDLLGELPGEVKLVRMGNPDPVDFIHLFAKKEAILHNEFPPLKSQLNKTGMLWVSWIKKSSKLETDISENDVRKLGLELGLVDVKICAVDEDWSGLKFMYRRKDR